MNFKFKNSGNTVQIPADQLLNTLPDASENELKILIYAASAATRNCGAFDEKAVAEFSGLDLTDVISALQFWRGAGVLTNASAPPSAKPIESTAAADTQGAENKPDGKQDAEPKVLQKFDIPQYSGEAVSRLLEDNVELVLLLDECCKIAGKILNPHESNKIIALYDYLGLSCEYILSVFDYCKKRNKTTIHYLEKTVFNLYNEGVDTDEKLREYLKKKEEFEGIAGQIRRLFGLTRSFTKNETEHLTKWKDTYNMSPEMLDYAYELTVNGAQKPSIAYMSRILDRWFNEGITTLEQAKESELKFKKAKEQPANNGYSSFDTDEFFNAALKNSYKNIGKKPDN